MIYFLISFLFSYFPELKIAENERDKGNRIEPRPSANSSLEPNQLNPLTTELADFFKKAELNLFLKDRKVYHIKQKPWAALGAAAPGRNLVPLLDSIRTWYGISSGPTAKEAKSILPRRQVGRYRAARPKPPTVLTGRMTNADQPEQRPKLNPNQGVIYQARQAG